MKKSVGLLFASIEDFHGEEILARFKKGESFDINALMFRPATSAADMTAQHDSQRNKRGGVRKRMSARTVVKKSVYRKYLKERIGHVGRLKSGWMAACEKLGIPVPNWVRNASRGESGYKEHSASFAGKLLLDELVAENKVPYSDRLAGSFFDYIFEKRINDLQRGYYAKRWEKQMAGALEGNTNATA